METTSTNISIDEVLDEFYKLKDKYETNYREKYVKPILISKKTNKEKRMEYAKLPKPECINCKRNVGSHFNIIPKENDYLRHYIIKCGDIVDPCSLDIQFNYSFREPFTIMIEKGIKEIDEVKLEIIKAKNNALFVGKNEQILGIFDKLTTELKLLTEDTGITIETNLLKNDNSDKKNVLQMKLNDFGKGCIIPFKSFIKQFMESQDIIYVNEAIEFYISEMMPKLKEIQQLKYEVNMVEYNDKDKEYYLIQKKNTLESKEHWFEVNDSVLAYVKGVKSTQNKTKKTGTKSKAKTLKLKSKIELVEEGEREATERETEEREVGQRVAEEREAEETKDKLLYDNLVYKLPETLRNLLQMDPKWLEKYVNMCIKNKKEGKPCKLMLPDQLQLPPKKLEDGSYDFNSIPINKVFNNLDEKYKQTLLSLYTEKDGQKNYSQLENALIKLLEDKAGFAYNKGYL